MADPRRTRAIGLAFFASGIAAALLYALLPTEVVYNQLFGVGLALSSAAALLFGGGWAIFSHIKARAQEALLGGKDVIARWRVDAPAWSEFIALNDELNREPGALVNELSLRNQVPDAGVEVIVGKTALLIDGSVHLLPRWGPPEIRMARLETGMRGPSFIELGLYYPGDADYPSSQSVLRFPVAAEARLSAKVVVEHFLGPRPGKPGFFHGLGDGSDPEDLSVCSYCGYRTHELLARCPKCGYGLASRRWVRRVGGVLLVCGLFINGLIGTVIYSSTPTLLQPGVVIDGTMFAGTPAMALAVLVLYGVVAVIGLSSLVSGLWLMKTGRRNVKVIIRALIVLSALLGLAVLAVVVTF